MKRKSAIIGLFAALLVITVSSCNRKTCPAYNKAAAVVSIVKSV